MMMMMTKATTLPWGKHGARRVGVRVRRASVRRVRMRRARVRGVTRVRLSHLQRDLVAQEVGVMHHVSYSSSVSTFCRNEIKDGNYKSIQQHIFISFSFSGKKWLGPPYARCHFRWKFSYKTLPPPPPPPSKSS